MVCLPRAGSVSELIVWSCCWRTARPSVMCSCSRQWSPWTNRTQESCGFVAVQICVDNKLTTIFRRNTKNCGAEWIVEGEPHNIALTLRRTLFERNFGKCSPFLSGIIFRQRTTKRKGVDFYEWLQRKNFRSSTKGKRSSGKCVKAPQAISSL